MKINPMLRIGLLLVLSFLVTSFFTSRVNADEINFLQTLRCNSVIKSELTVQVSSSADTLQISYQDRGQALRSILNTMVDSGSLMRPIASYRCFDLSFEVPLDQCQLDEQHPELFSCSATLQSLAFSLKARLSCYQNEGETYHGELQGYEIKSAQPQNNPGFLRLNGTFDFKNGRSQADFVSDNYRAHFWQYDGITQKPECNVNGVALVYPK